MANSILYTSSAAPNGSQGLIWGEVDYTFSAKYSNTYSRLTFAWLGECWQGVSQYEGTTYTYDTGTISVTANGKTIKNKDITVNGDVVKPANLQLQLASIQNQQGMLLTGGNIYSTGPNCGDITFSMGNTNGFGEIASGGLESSNVNLSVEFANMILSQRAIDANSRVFSATSEVLQALVRMT